MSCIRVTAVVLFLCALASAPCWAQAPEAKLVVSYDAAKTTLPKSPKEQGWTETSGCKLSAESVAVAKDDGGLSAWQIVDDDANGDEDLYYLAPLADDVQTTAYDDGFSMRWRVRMVEEWDAGRGVSTEACVGSAAGRLRFCFFLGRDDAGLKVQTILSREADGTPSAELKIAKPDGYHMWTFIYDGAKNGSKGTLYVDDKVILTGKFDFGDTGDAVCFGSKATGRGIGNWNLFEFYTGKLPAPKAEEKAKEKK